MVGVVTWLVNADSVVKWSAGWSVLSTLVVSATCWRGAVDVDSLIWAVTVSGSSGMIVCAVVRSSWGSGKAILTAELLMCGRIEVVRRSVKADGFSSPDPSISLSSATEISISGKKTQYSEIILVALRRKFLTGLLCFSGAQVHQMVRTP